MVAVPLENTGLLPVLENVGQSEQFPRAARAAGARREEEAGGRREGTHVYDSKNHLDVHARDRASVRET